MLPSPTHNINIFALSINLLHVGSGWDCFGAFRRHVTLYQLILITFHLKQSQVRALGRNGAAIGAAQDRSDDRSRGMVWHGPPRDGELECLEETTRCQGMLYGNDRCHVESHWGRSSPMAVRGLDGFSLLLETCVNDQPAFGPVIQISILLLDSPIRLHFWLVSGDWKA